MINLESDIYSANIAKTIALKIIELLGKNEKDLDRKTIIKLESCAMSLIRGVEQFNDLTIQVEHQKYSKLRYEFLEYIDPFL